MEVVHVDPTHAAAQTSQKGGILQHKLKGPVGSVVDEGGVCCTQAAVRRRRWTQCPRQGGAGRGAGPFGRIIFSPEGFGGCTVGPQQKLTDQSKRPREARVPVPPEVNHRPNSQFNLDGDLFLRNLRSARRGAAGGPSGMTVEHLQPLLDHNKDAKLFCQVAELLSRAQVPASVRDAVRLEHCGRGQCSPSGGQDNVPADDGGC